MGESEISNMEGQMSIHQQATIPADPHRVYQVLADAEALSALSGKSGKAARTEGQMFAAFDGNVAGRQIELVPDTRISHPLTEHFTH
jgi:uncharacterized protein YndB with AHSA1/START domain